MRVNKISAVGINAKVITYTHNPKRKYSLLITLMMSTALATAGAGYTFPAQAQSNSENQSSRIYNLPAQPMSRALMRFSDLSGVQLFFDANLVRGKTSPAISDNLNREQALSQLLAGSGLSYKFTSPNIVTITADSNKPVEQGASFDADGALLLDTITVTGVNSISAADAPYATPGSSAYLSAEQIDQRKGTSAGDIFRGIPGVISAESRNSGAVDINIRGLQGQGRAPVVVDGASQETTVYRGYNGAQSRSYIDPDLIGSVSIEKGPSAGADAVGAIGGIVRMSTINADDILLPDQTVGIRIKGSVNNNSTPAPGVGTEGGIRGDGGTYPAGQLPVSYGDILGMDRPGFLAPSGGSGSIAIAGKTDNIEIVAAYARRKNGNYYAGKNGGDSAHPVFTQNPNGTTTINRGGLNQYRAGEEVLNTSISNKNWLLKGKFESDNGHSVELGYTKYLSTYGEIMPTQIWNTFTSGPYQGYLHNIDLDTYTAKYRWNPDDNDLFDLKVNAFYTDMELRMNAASKGGSQVAPIYWYSSSERKGITISNTSRFDGLIGDFSLNYGAGFTRDDLGVPGGDDKKALYTGNSFAPREGHRDEWNTFASMEWKPTNWLTFAPSIRYSHYDTFDRNGSLSGPGLNGYYITYGDPIEHSNGGWSPMATLTIEPTDGLQFYGKASSSMRSPSPFEGISGFSFAYFDSASIVEPERNKSIELGTNYIGDDVFMDGDKFRLHAAYFDNKIDNYITRVGKAIRPFPWNPSYVVEALSMVNLDYARMRGFEVSAEYDTGKYFGGISWNHYTDMMFCAKDGDLSVKRTQCSAGGLFNSYSLQQVPPKNTVTIDAGVRFLEEKLTLGGRITYVGKRMVDGIGDGSEDEYLGGQLNASKWNPYTLVDLYMSYKPNEAWQINVGIDNLTDRYYMDALNASLMPAPGRTFRMDIAGKLGSDAPLFSADMWNDLFRPNSFERKWSGFYAGGHIGYAWGRVAGKTTTMDGSTNAYTQSESIHPDIEGASYGVQAGYNHQFKNGIVAGFEAQLSRPSISGTQYSLALEGVNIQDQLQSMTHYEYDLSADIKGKLGYSFSNILVYGTAGVAFLNEKRTRTQYQSFNANFSTGPEGRSTIASFSERDKKLRTGLLLGGGVEYALSENWSLRADYNYTRFGRETFKFNDAREGVSVDVSGSIFCFDGSSSPDCNGLPEGVHEITNEGKNKNVNGRSTSSKVDFHTIKIGLNYQF
ncbi:TonB-dependent receptor domain-containing protein [Brucellaceae bacterium C25G]